MADVYALLDTWIEHVKDPELLAELTKLKEDGDTGAITDAFSKTSSLEPLVFVEPSALAPIV